MKPHEIKKLDELLIPKAVGVPWHEPQIPCPWPVFAVVAMVLLFWWWSERPSKVRR